MDKTDEEPSGTQISSLISGSSDDISTKESCAEKGAASPAKVVAGDNNPVPLTKENLEVLEGSSERKNEDDISLIVHVDESVNDLDNDILDTPTKDSNESSTTEKTDEDASKESCGNQPEAASTSPAAATKNKEQSQDKSKEDAETKPEDISLDASKATAVKQPASSSGSGEKSTESAEKKEEEKSDAKKPASTNSRNLWVSGLSSSTKATDLKTLFSKHGKVAGAKVVTNARSPGARCYGFITMSSPDEASKCIQHLHRTELHGRMISVERAKNDPSAQSKLAAAKKPEGSGKPLGAASSGPAKPGDKKEIGHPGEKKDDQGSAKKDDRRDLDRRDRPRSGPVRRHSGDMRGCRARPYRHGDHPSRDHARHPNDRRHPPPAPRAHSRHGSQQKNEPPAIKKDTPVKKDPVKKETPVKKEGEGDSGSAPAVETEKSADEEAKNKEEMLDFEKIKEERERERQKQRERERREEEKRKARLLEKERLRQREIERRQREEARRLERERERLRSEKARLEEERLEAERQRIMLERERQQRERERLEREREEERRMDALRKREENQRRAAKRTFDSRGPRDDYGGWNEPKRPTVTEPSRGDRGAENRGGEPYQRRVERYNRRDGRPIEGGPAGPPAETTGSRFSRRDERRDESHRHDAPSTRVSRRETSGPRQARGSSNEQHDSGVKYGRDRYEDRSDRRNESGVPAMSSRDGDRRDSTRDRHERRAPPSPHHTSRSSPPHRSQDSRAEWKDSRGSNSLSTNRDVRESGGRYGGVSTQDMNQSTSWHGSRGTMSVSAVEERNKPRGSYNPGPGILGTVPSTVDQWQRAPPERSAAVSSHPQPVHTRPPPERAWAPVTAAPVERVPRQVAASPIINPGQVLHVPPTSSGFLASAANIMMSVGLAGNRSAQDVRYDAYKPVSGNIRRY